tara:strand:+ start:329 stop:736 length:408 start_codon:yes stop_codon:yes gene_type:complete
MFSITELDEKFMRAAETERRLPPAIRRQKLAFWVDYANDWKGYGYQAFSPKLSPAKSDEVTEYEQMLQISIDYAGEKDRKIIWLVAHSAVFRERGPKWTEIARELGVDRRAVKIKYQDALIRLNHRLKKIKQFQK